MNLVMLLLGASTQARRKHRPPGSGGFEESFCSVSQPCLWKRDEMPHYYIYGSQIMVNIIQDLIAKL